MSNVSVVFDADTGKYVANIGLVERSTAKAADAVARAKSKILAYNQEQIESAKRLGASTETLQKIQEKTASALVNVTENSANKVIANLDRISERNKRVAAELANLGKVKGSSGHSEFTQRMATSAAVRGLEGNVGIRPVENILASIPALAAPIQAVGTGIGVAALVTMVVDLGLKGKEALEKIENATKVTREQIALLGDDTAKTSIALDLQSDKLQLSISKLEHKPANFLKLAIDEDREAIEETIDSVKRARGEFDKFFEKAGVGEGSSMFSGFVEQLKSLANLATSGPLMGGKLFQDTRQLVSTDADQKFADEQQKSIEIAGRVAEARISKASTESEKRAAEMLTRADQLQAYNLAVENTQKRISATHARAAQDTGGNYSAVFDVQDAVLGKLQQDRENFEKRNGIAADKVRQDRDERAKADATAAREARSKAAEAQFKQMEARFAELEKNADGELSAAAKINFWERQSRAAGVYSENVTKVLEKIGPLTQEYYRQLGEAADRATAEQRAEAAQQRAAARAIEEDDRRFLTIVKNSEERDERAAAAAEKLADARRNNANAMAEWIAQQEVATGVLTRHDAAVQLAARHEAEYAAKLDEIAARRARLKGRLDLDDEQKQTGYDELDVEKTNTEGARDRQSAADKVAIDQSTVSGAVRAIISEFEAQSKDFANISARFTTEALQSTNEQLTRLMTGQKTDFKGLGRGIATDVTGIGLRGAEGKLLESFGLGTKKPAGSSSDPIFTKSVDDLMSKGSGSLSINKLLGKGDDDDSDGGGGFLSGIASVLKIPGFAAGGAIGPNTLAMVGENGPELFVPKTGGTIIPNHSLSQVGGFTHHGDIVVNAPGAGPETVAQLRGMFAQDSAQIAQSVFQKAVSQKMRTPATQRKW